MTVLKKIEIALSNLLISFLQNKNPQVFVESKTAIFNNGQIQKILLLRHDRIGDLLISTPLLNILRCHFPEKQFDILLGEKNIGAKDIVEPFVDSIFLFEKKFDSLFKLFRELKKQKYDLIIDLFDEPSTTSSVIIRLLNVKNSLGLKKEKCYAYSHLVPLLDRSDNHIVLRTAMLMLPFDLNPENHELNLIYKIDDRSKIQAENILGKKLGKIRLGINLSGSNRGKFWGIENNIGLIINLQEKYSDIQIVLFGTKDYAEELFEIKNQVNVLTTPFVNSVKEYAAMLSTCDFLITPDTAAVHFASAFGIPTIPLYNMVIEGQNRVPWTPFNTPFEAVTTSSENLSDIKPQKVVEAFNKLSSRINNNQELK